MSPAVDFRLEDVAITHRVQEIAKALEPGLRDLDPAWPKGACVETTGCYYALLVPPYELTWILGWFDIEGKFEDNHHWLRTPTGLIIDPTRGQFDDSEPLRIVAPKDPDQRLYTPGENWMTHELIE